MAVSVLVLLLVLQQSSALPAQRNGELVDILGRLHGVLGDLRDFLQEEQATRGQQGASSADDTPPAKSDPIADLEQRNEETPSARGRAASSNSKDVSLRDVLSYLLELERERQKHSQSRSPQQRDHDIPFPFAQQPKNGK